MQQDHPSTKARHTPGPWRIGSTFDDASIEICDDAQMLAQVWSGEDADQRLANARLIAAAPETAAERDRLKAINAELLAAMKALFEHCAMIHNTWGDGCNQKEADAAIKAARAAIAKATQS